MERVAAITIIRDVVGVCGKQCCAHDFSEVAGTLPILKST